MTKEELEKEAEDYAREWLYHVKDLELHHKEDDKPEYIRIKEAYLASAEPREKRIEELEAIVRNTKAVDESFAKLQLENTELKADNDARKFAMAMSEKVEKQLREENAELRYKFEHRNCLDCSNHSSKLRMKTLELEKECTNVIRNLLSAYTTYADSFDDRDNEIVEEAVQFLSEVEK